MLKETFTASAEGLPIAARSKTSPFHPSVLTVGEAKTVEKALALLEKRCLRERPVLDRQSMLERYLMLRFAGLTNEQLHVLYLDIRFQLLDARTEFLGNQSHVATDIRQIVLHAIMLGAEHVVLAHNHPSDNPNPSKEDIAHLIWHEDILGQLSIKVLDSFVVTTSGITSTKAVIKRDEEEKERRRRYERELAKAQRRAKIAATKARKRALESGDPDPVGADSATPSPMMVQYHAIKAQNPEHLLFYRMGDFYELFFEDAEIAAMALGLVLTKRGKHEGRAIPLCGVPIERSEDYLHRLIAQGYKVAICEQVEDPAEARRRGSKSVVRRDVVRLVTPGTIIEDRLFDPVAV